MRTHTLTQLTDKTDKTLLYPLLLHRKVTLQNHSALPSAVWSWPVTPPNRNSCSRTTSYIKLKRSFLTLETAAWQNKGLHTVSQSVSYVVFLKLTHLVAFLSGWSGSGVAMMHQLFKSLWREVLRSCGCNMNCPWQCHSTRDKMSNSHSWVRLSGLYFIFYCICSW